MVELRFIVAGQVVLCQIGVIYCPIRGIVNDRVQDPISKGPGLSVWLLSESKSAPLIGRS